MKTNIRSYQRDLFEFYCEKGADKKRSSVVDVPIVATLEVIISMMIMIMIMLINDNNDNCH